MPVPKSEWVMHEWLKNLNNLHTYVCDGKPIFLLGIQEIGTPKCANNCFVVAHLTRMDWKRGKKFLMLNWDDRQEAYINYDY